MGTDIHVHSEIKIDGRWEHYLSHDEGRWYELFSLMGLSYRSYAPTIVPIKPLPDDLNPLTRLLVMDSDMHNPSWLNIKDIGKLKRYFKKNDITPPLFIQSIEMDPIFSEYEFRFIYCFDS